MSKLLIKSSQRVRDLGEVFTPDFLVEKMLDQFPLNTWEPDKNWLEPTCGNGQFILAIIRRKIASNLLTMKPVRSLMVALNTTFGTDIMADNISECRGRIYNEIVVPHWHKHKIRGKIRDDQRWRVACFVMNNIRETKDALKEDYSKFQHFADIGIIDSDLIISSIKTLLTAIDSETEIDSPLYKELLPLR